MPQPQNTPSILSLTEVLNRAAEVDLRKLVGEDAVHLLESVAGTGRATTRDLANLIVGRLGLAGALSSDTVRTLVLASLDDSEANYLCGKLGLPTPAALRVAPFDQIAPYARELFSLFEAPYYEKERAPPPSSRLVSPQNGTLDPRHLRSYSALRQSLGRRNRDILVRMPLGWGKIRIVASAVVDVLRSTGEGDLAIWLADGDRLCEDIFQECLTIWTSNGTRDLTMFRAFGLHQMPNFGGVANSVIVADVKRFCSIAATHQQVSELGKRLRCIVLSDANHIFNKQLADLLAKLRLSGGGNVIGISSAPKALMRIDESEPLIELRYQETVLPTPEEGEDWLARGMERDFDVEIFQSGFSGTIGVADFDVSETSQKELEKDLERSRKLIDLIAAEVAKGGSVAFHAISAEQARTFAGVLRHRAAIARVVTSEMSLDQQEQEARQFMIQEEAKVLCIHNVPLLDKGVRKTNVVIMASPTISFSKLATSLGRFLIKRENGVRLKVMLVDDGFAPFTNMAGYINSWDKMETSA